MQTVKALILSMTKRQEYLPWSIKFRLENGQVFTTTIGTPGGITVAGTLFEKFITDAEPKMKQYPFVYNLLIHPADKRIIDVRFIAEKPAILDMRQATATYLLGQLTPSNFVAAEETVTIEEDTNTFTQMVQENARIAAEQAAQEYDPGTVTVPGDVTATETVTAEFVSSVNRYWIFFDSKDVYVVDGDTIHGYITGYAWPNGEQVPEYIGNQKMLNNSEKVAIRYLGVDTFESAGNQYRNAKAAKLYGNVPWEALNTAGAEAKEYNHTMIAAGKIIAISIQYNTVTKEQVYDDASKRIMGVVYSTNYANWEEASAAVKGNYFKGINVNKELLKPMYSDYEAILEAYPQSIAIPLAEYTSLRFSKATDGIKIATWMDELSLRNPPTEIVLEESYGATEEEIAGATDANANLTAYSSRKKLRSETRQDTSPMGYINNDLSFVKPYDDRAVEQRAYRADVVGDNELPWDYANRVRIGDVFIPIPPLSIRLDKQYSTEKVSVMRAKSSLQKNVGNVRNILTMDLYYHDLESINGTEMTGYLEQIGSIPVTYAMDGLRPLLAQFKKAPFLPIDNQYVNETLKINNVALRNIHVQTVPGFPSALKVTLMVEEFDASPYLMGEVSLGKKINYPLLRWHYQHLLREPFKPEPWRTYLPKVEHLDNQITFSILDEQELNTRQEIVRQFRSTKTPTEYKEELLDGEDNYGDGESEEEKEFNDGLRIRAALEQMDTFVKYVKNVKTADLLGREYDKYAKIPVVIGEGLGYDAAEQYLLF